MEGDPNIDVSRSNRMRQADESLEDFELRTFGKNDEPVDWGEGEGETSFTNPNEDEQFFKKVNQDEFKETNLRAKLVNTLGKKDFFKKEFGTTINKTAGKASKTLYSKIKIEKGNDNNVVSVTFDGGLILTEKFDENKNKYILGWSDNRTNIKNFKLTLDKAVLENTKNPEFIYGGQLEFPLSEETTLKINKDAVITMQNVGEKLYHQIKNSKNLTSEEVAELDGVFFKDWDHIFDNKDKKLVKANLKALEQEKHYWENKAILEPNLNKDGAKEIYKKIVKLINLKIDEVNIRLNEKPTSEIGVKILEKEAKASYLLWWDKIKQWVKDNPYKTGVAATIAGYLLTIGGFLINLLEGGKDVVVAGAAGLAKLGYFVMNITKNLGPVLAALWSLVSGSLSVLSTGIGYLAHNFWLLAIAIIYPIYREYKRLRGGKPKKKPSRKKIK